MTIYIYRIILTNPRAAFYHVLESHPQHVANGGLDQLYPTAAAALISSMANCRLFFAPTAIHNSRNEGAVSRPTIPPGVGRWVRRAIRGREWSEERSLTAGCFRGNSAGSDPRPCNLHHKVACSFNPWDGEGRSSGLAVEDLARIRNNRF